jgi:hypothetical protein
MRYDESVFMPESPRPEVDDSLGVAFSISQIFAINRLYDLGKITFGEQSGENRLVFLAIKLRNIEWKANSPLMQLEYYLANSRNTWVIRLSSFLYQSQ